MTSVIAPRQQNVCAEAHYGSGRRVRTNRFVGNLQGERTAHAGIGLVESLCRVCETTLNAGIATPVFARDGAAVERAAGSRKPVRVGAPLRVRADHAAMVLL